MQLDKNLTLTKAICMARKLDEIKWQQTDIRGNVNSAADAVMANKHKQSYKEKKNTCADKASYTAEQVRSENLSDMRKMVNTYKMAVPSKRSNMPHMWEKGTP